MEEIIQKMKKDDNRWRGNQNKESLPLSLENSRPFTYNNWSFGEQLHLCPSYYTDLPSKSLSFLFNQFDPYFHNIPLQNTSHENSNSPLIQNYHFTLSNRQILLSYNRSKIYGCFTYTIRFFGIK